MTKISIHNDWLIEIFGAFLVFSIYILYYILTIKALDISHLYLFGMYTILLMLYWSVVQTVNILTGGRAESIVAFIVAIAFLICDFILMQGSPYEFGVFSLAVVGMFSMALMRVVAQFRGRQFKLR